MPSKIPPRLKSTGMQIVFFILVGLLVLGLVFIFIAIFVVNYIAGIALVVVGGVCVLFTIGFWIGVSCSHIKKKTKVITGNQCV